MLRALLQEAVALLPLALGGLGPHLLLGLAVLMAEGLLEVGAVVGTRVEGEADGRDEVGVGFEGRGALVPGCQGEAEDGPVGVQEAGWSRLQILNLGYFVVHINKPAQLVGLVCVGGGVLGSRGAFRRPRQAECSRRYS